jgi:hypothetical protein
MCLTKQGELLPANPSSRRTSSSGRRPPGHHHLRSLPHLVPLPCSALPAASADAVSRPRPLWPSVIDLVTASLLHAPRPIL